MTTGIESIQGFQDVRYKFFIHSLDLASSGAQELFKNNPSFKYQDVVDYFDVNSPAHWYRVQENADIYYQTWVKNLRTWKTQLVDFISSGDLNDIVSVEITPFIKTMTGYENNMEGFSNTIGFTIVQDDVIKQLNNNDDSITVTAKEYITENQIFEAQVSRDGGKTYYTEFLGFIGSVTYSREYNNIPDLTITAYGISKLLGTSATVQKQAVYQQFEEGVSITTPGVPVYQDNWNSLNTYNIFTEIMKSILNFTTVGTPPELDNQSEKVRALGQQQEAETALVQKYADDEVKAAPADKAIIERKRLASIDKLAKTIEERNKAITELNKQAENNRQSLSSVQMVFNEDGFNNLPSFRTSFLVLYTYYLVRRLRGSAQTILTTPGLEGIRPDTTAVIVDGAHKTFNEQVSKNFNLFYSEMTKPIELLESIKSQAFYDVFETRTGIMVCRPPRYNDLPIDSTFEGTDVSDNDFVIKFNDILRTNYSRNDMELNSRCDVKNTYMFIGEIPLYANSFTDPNILFKYGLRSAGVVSNPNVGNSWLAAMYGALVLYKQNMFTRTINIEVANDRVYSVGNLYYIQLSEKLEDEFVGYLMSSEITFGYGGVSKNILKFSAIRRVKRFRVGDGFTPSELDMIYRIYKDKIVATLNISFNDLYKNQSDPAKRQQYAQSYINSLPTGSRTQLLCFSLIPTIIDVVNAVEHDPGKGAQEKGEADIQSNKSRGSNGAGILGDKYVYYSIVSKFGALIGNYPMKYIDAQNNFKAADITYKQLTNKNYGYSGYTQDWAEVKTENLVPVGGSSGIGMVPSYIVTPFLTQWFHVSESGNNYIDQRLINAITIMDISYKMYNSSVVGRIPGAFPYNASTGLMEDSMPAIRRRYDCMVFQYHKIPKVGHENDAPFFLSDWYNTTSARADNTIPTTLDPDYITKYQFKINMPSGVMYSIESQQRVDVAVLTGGEYLLVYSYQYTNQNIYKIQMFKKVGNDYVNLQDSSVREWVYPKDGLIVDTVNVSLGILAQLNIFNPTARAIAFIPTTGLSNVIDVSTCTMLYDMEKVISTDVYDDLLYAFRDQTEASDLATTSGVSESQDSRDPHTRGLAIDISTVKMREQSGGYINLNFQNAFSASGTCFYTFHNNLCTAMKALKFNTIRGKNILVKNHYYPFDVPAGTSWVKSDRLIHLEA